uniref:J domain-containing protein n=1 Tax=Kalanchoe fedtschenkoi TaxID=63787 RepID=A0A7N1A153_KALFE
MLEMDFGRRSASYYEILGVGFDSSAEEIRRAYRKLAMRWHPDKWARNPSLLGEAKLRFQQIQEAYSVLSDQSKRTLYDAGMYDPEEEEQEGFSDFVQEMVTLMAKVKREVCSDPSCNLAGGGVRAYGQSEVLMAGFSGI